MVNLNELSKDEWKDVYRIFKPDASEKQFEQDWEDFCKYKEKKKLQ